MRLDQLQSGQAGIIVALSHTGQRLRRLLEMGFSEGAHVQLVRRAPLGDPLEISLGDFRLSLRLEDAALIEVKLRSPWPWQETLMLGRPRFSTL